MINFLGHLPDEIIIFLTDIISVGLTFLFLCLVFQPLEWAFPAKRAQKIFRPYWKTDLCFFLGHYLLWSGLILGALSWLHQWLDWQMPVGFRTAIAAQPLWLQAIEVIILSDLMMYWGHRLQHRIEFLWKFHSIHHSAEHLDWLATHRDHPIDTAYTIIFMNLPPLLLGFPLHTLAGIIAFRAIWGIYLHSNVRLPLGPFGILLGGPEFHHWHHDKERDSGNYANSCPLIDVIFGTYHRPNHEPDNFGLREAIPQGYWSQLLYPFRRKNNQ
jgi:sterol desaturase/sphingolipid hydroxylase (fatty acid hydroxylase superfamily)